MLTHKTVRLFAAFAIALAMIFGSGFASPAMAASSIYVRPGGDDTNCDGTADLDYPGGTGPLACAVQTMQQGINLVDAGGTVFVRAGTYALSAAVDVNKAGITLDGDGAGVTVVQVSGTGDRFNITAAGVTLQDFEILKTDKTGEQNIIRLTNGNNVTIKNNTIHGQFVIGDGEVSRAIVINAGAFSGINIEGNTIYALRQPAYVSGTHTGAIKNNYVYGTKGWVLEGGNLTFTGNTWGSGANANVYDIAILATAGVGPYPDIVAMSNANNGAFIEDQRTSPATLSIVYVDGSVVASGDGTARSPKKAISEGITRVAAGGTVNVLAGTYVENLTTSKALTLAGPNAAINPNTGTRVGEAILVPATSDPDPTSATAVTMLYVGASNVTIKGFTFDGDNPALTSGKLVKLADVDACEAIAGSDGVGNIVVENNIIKNTAYSGIDFYNYTNDAATSGNYIRYNRIANIGHIPYGFGVGVIIYNNFYADVTDNVMTDVRVGIQTGNFYRANPGTTAHLSNNQIASTKKGIFHNLAYSNASPFTIDGNALTVADEAGAPRWDGIMLSSLQGAVNAIVTNNTITAVDVTQVTVGYQVWNDPTTAALTVSGGSVTGADYGVWVNNFDGYPSAGSNGDSTTLAIDGVQISNASLAGIYVKDNPSNSNGATVGATIQNSTITGSTVGVLIEGLDATATAHRNRITSNTTYGVNNTSPTMLNFENNWWGSASGPGPVGPGSGDNVSTNVDYTPWGFAMVTMATSTAAEVGELVTMDTQVVGTGVFGAQLRVNFDSTALQFQAPPASSYNNVAAAGWYWDSVPEQFTAQPGGIRLSGTMLNPPHSTGATLTGQSIATWKFKCLKAGTFALTFDTSAGTGTYLSDINGFDLLAGVQGASVECKVATGSVDGYIKLQGRLGTNPSPAGWNGAIVTLTCASASCTGFGPFTMTTDATGHYQLTKTTPGSGIVVGTYSASVSRRAYLSAAKTTNVTIVAGSNTINTLATAPTLLGGDVTGDQQIRIGDLSAIGGVFGTIVPADTGADVNGDGYVNIFDLVLAGSNYERTSVPSIWP